MKTYLKQLSQFAVINFVVLTIIVVSLMKAKEMQTPVPTQKPITVTMAPTTLPASGSNTSSPVVTEPSVQPRSLATELPSHNNTSDCWLFIGGKYYDVTTYFGSHPGGDGELAKYCGKDATNAFATKDKSSPQDHSAAAKAMLEQYLIQ